MQKKSMRLLVLLCLAAVMNSTSFARDKASANAVIANVENQLAKPSGIEDDASSPVMISWIGTGKLGVYTISNTGQNGYFEPPPAWPGYTGEWPSGYASGNGNTGEFPRGTQQFYVWSAGFWVGAMVQKQIGDQIITEPRVATAAYYSDQGALSDLYQSNQRIPEGDEGEGDFLFKQKGISNIEAHQRLWTYADTSAINARRRAVGHPELALNPENGDYLSNEDTYCVWGDYFPEGDAAVMFSDGYDTEPVGIRVEQRTYSWSTDSYIYMTYHITNMNDFPLENVYFGYFMDNDVGDATDDLIGYDANLNLGYSYDSDFQETGWPALAGYIGTVFLTTPKNEFGQELGLTGFQTWTIDGDESSVDDSGRDELKYMQLAKTSYEVFTEPQDVRQLASSGPVRTMQPGETVEVTIAVIAGGSLSEVKENTQLALERFSLGYIGPEAPPSPNLVVEPDENRAILAWDNFPEAVQDPYSGLIDFEGYRIYKSDDNGLTWGEETADLERYPNGWVPIAEFDIPGNETGRYVATAYSSGASEASIEFEGYTADVDNNYIEARYAIEFLAGKELMVYNLSQQKSYSYNAGALADGNGFAILHRTNNSAYPDAVYRSNELITFDGILLSISDKVDSLGVTLSSPAVGDVFTVQTFASSAIGEQLGLDYVYIDEGLTNGVTYAYSVTAFDKGDQTIDLPSLEGSLFTNMTKVVPRGRAVDRTLEDLSLVIRTAGASAGTLSTSIHNPLEMITADFRVEFFGSDTLTKKASYLRIINSTADTVVVDSAALTAGTAGAGFYGLNLTAAGPAVASIDTSSFGWIQGSSSFDFSIVGEKPQPFDYEVEFVDAIDAATFTGDEVILPPGTPAPWRVTNLTLDKKAESYGFPPITVGFGQNGIIRIMKENYTNLNDFAFGLQLDKTDTSDPIQPGDTWTVNTIKPFLTDDEFTFSTRGFNEVKAESEYSLKDVNVVPNPYYVRAQWDTDRFNKHLKFTHLPGHCKIRIFTTSGILIRTIEHNVDNGDPIGYHSWIMRNEDNMDIASGLYIYQVKDMTTGKEKVGKFAVIL